MRLCRPSFQVEDTILRLDPFDLFAGEDLFDDPGVSLHLLDTAAAAGTAAAVREGEFSYRGRFQLRDPIDAMALPGFLMLPQSFGAIYLGETFCSYISVNNSSNFEARDVVIKVLLPSREGLFQIRKRWILIRDEAHWAYILSLHKDRSEVDLKIDISFWKM